MKEFIITSFLFFTPVSLYPANTPDMEKLGKAMKINCKTVGEDSCFARFISLAACSFSYGIAHSEKTVKESLDIADDLFLLLAKGNRLDPKEMFDDKKLIKQAIRVETVERVDKCKEWTRKAIPKIVLERTGIPATLEFIDGATRTFGEWWLRSIEGIRRDAINNYQSR